MTEKKTRGSAPVDPGVITGTQILLDFDNEEIVDGIKLTCRRKGIDLEQYIIDNFEWDRSLPCMNECGFWIKPTQEICDGCDYTERCPDAVRGARGRSPSSSKKVKKA